MGTTRKAGVENCQGTSECSRETFRVCVHRKALMLARNLATARTAFLSGDRDLSRAAHVSPNTVPPLAATSPGSEPGHARYFARVSMVKKGCHNMLSAFCSASAIHRHVFDTFTAGVVAAAVICIALRPFSVSAGASFLPSVLPALATLAVCIGIKNYTSYRAEKLHYSHERAREEW